MIQVRCPTLLDRIKWKERTNLCSCILYSWRIWCCRCHNFSFDDNSKILVLFQEENIFPQADWRKKTSIIGNSFWKTSERKKGWQASRAYNGKPWFIGENETYKAGERENVSTPCSLFPTYWLFLYLIHIICLFFWILMWGLCAHAHAHLPSVLLSLKLQLTFSIFLC